jgi:DNA-binding IclR family transcriptional regulator
VTLKQLAKVCADVRNLGFATDDGEYIEGIRCVAAPIRSGDGIIMGAIGISAPSLRFSDDRYRTCAEQVVETAKEISLLLSNPEEA